MASRLGVRAARFCQQEKTPRGQAFRTTARPDAGPRERDRLRDGGSSEPAELRSLTPQERRILELIAEGHTNRQIGEKLFLAEKTVKNYVSVVLCKLGVDRRTKAALVGAEARAAMAAGRA